jgi:hypothetical protein
MLIGPKIADAAALDLSDADRTWSATAAFEGLRCFLAARRQGGI